MWRVFSGLFMGWGLGANDAANLFGPGVSAKIVKYRTATILIAVFALLGASLEGTKCMHSLGNLGDITGNNEAFIILLSTSLCILIMSFFGIPLSTSQAVVGAVIGIGLVKGAKTISFGKIFQIIMGWFLTPFVCRNFFAWNFLFAENIRIQCDIIKKQLLFINMNKLLLKHSLTKLLFTM